MICFGVNNLKCLLLDLDGTLINSEKAFSNSFKKVLLEFYNINITDSDYKKYELEQNAKLIKYLKENGLINKLLSDSEIMDKIYTDYVNEFRKVILEPEAVENFELLKQIKEKEIILGLITTCRRFYLDILFENLNLNNLFSIVVAREDVPNLKPASDAYLLALEKLGMNSYDCLALEDSKRGIMAALNANIPTVKVDNFTSIKENMPDIIECESANFVLKRILKTIN